MYNTAAMVAVRKRVLMKKIIDGKRYDTDRASHIANLWNGHPRHNFQFEDTDLYLTKAGNWFLAGSGGPMSRWCETVGNASTYGSGIEPISPDEARAMLESANRVDLLEFYFSSGIKDA